MTNHLRLSAETRWYDLFSRGARDWLRHNQKMRQAVRDNLLNLIGSTDVITNPTDRTMRVPVRLLEHARFRLADAETQTGAGQGKGKPGEVLRPARPEQGDDDPGTEDKSVADSRGQASSPTVHFQSEGLIHTRALRSPDGSVRPA